MWCLEFTSHFRVRFCFEVRQHALFVAVLLQRVSSRSLHIKLCGGQLCTCC